jgi:two-component system NtrC family sensor kinase
VLETAVHTGRGSVGIEVIPLEEITRMSPALEDRVRLALVDTPRARPGGSDIETRAMVVRALQPVRDASGRLVALLDAGVVLNRNYAFVDRIRDLVYGPGSLPEGGWGAVSVLLGDTRITTNVPMGGADGGRALGTRMSAEVAERVLEQGETWIDRAFVVDDWYVSAYEPIEDVGGNRVGALYSGFLEAPYRRAHRRNLTVLLGLAALALALSMGLSIRGAESIFRPVEAMARVVQAKQAGRRLRVGRIASRDEIGTLARQLDALLDQLDQRNRQIQGAADVLEQKVRERTHELSAQNIRLQETIALLHQTRRQLVTAEKLAALGELTAGVAHEINNPAAVILGNLEVVIDRLGRGAEPFRTELDLIIEQVYRIRAIVDRLLQYARPAEYANQLEEIDANRVVEDSLVLVRHELERKGVRLTTRLEARTGVCINRQELQQVLVNLLLNATRAVDQGGQVEVESGDWADTGVVIRVRDDGPGIPPDRLERIFDPFFTTDPEHGSGLGLSVSYGLVARYGGRITVDSAPGQGACFNLFLRRVPAAAQDLPAEECAGAG